MIQPRRTGLFFLAILLLLSGSVCRAESNALDSLDRIIRGRAVFEEKKREDIQNARSGYERASDDAAKYNALRGLYESYRSFRVDSAIIVAKERLNIARRIGQPSKIASATINLAEGYMRSGSADAAIAMLDTLSRSSLEDYHLKYRNGVYREAYRTKAENAIIESERLQAREKLKELTDSALASIPKDSRGYYTLTAERLCDAGLYSEAVATIEEANRKYDFKEDAAMMATMGDIYYKSGKRDKAKECLARAAILDLSAGTKEYRSLISLTPILLEEGDIKRAFEYINCAFEDSEFSHAYLRTAEIMKSMPVIDKAYHSSQREIVRRTRIFLAAASILAVCLLILLVWYINALKAKRRMLATIRSINENLEEKNEALAKADSLKLQYINTLMKANSEYISRLKSFRLKIFRFMKTGQYQKVVDFVNSSAGESRDIAAFQTLFDDAFLSIFPDFISKVNPFMKEVIRLKEPGRLSPELRVIAMMKLQMASTEEISGLLHYSNQTVYNLRTSIRSMINISWEEFETEIEKL